MSLPLASIGTLASIGPLTSIGPLASIGSTIRDFDQATGQLFDDLSKLHWGALAISLAFFGAYLVVRSRASFNALRAAYPNETFEWRRIWGAYVAAYGLNGVVPAGSGSVVQVVLTHNSIPNSTYPAVTSALSVGVIFDGLIYGAVTVYAFTQGVFPKPKDFGSLQSWDIAFFGRHPDVTLFIVTALGILIVAGFALLSRRVVAFWRKIRQGLAILWTPRRYLTGMCVPQAAGWVLRIASYWYLLEAFRIGGSVRGAILVLAAQAIASLVPFTPGGVGVQQALLVVIFSSTSTTDSVAVFSVGQQIVITAFTLVLGFAALLFIFRYRSFGQVLREARSQSAEQKALAKQAEAEKAETAHV
ncbi:MAG TPA: lysylphosphatidylglycerol synthase domain-containing protein [Solirubrobacteraceae bacterium]|nr:lysylphosphatidylglycerol synthase domain-containing protein [Solirubrobacteraceae bacterium]